MKRTAILGACLLAATSLWSQRPMTAPAGGKAISDHLIGIFFEDISNAADGGLYAELVQNGAFEYNAGERAGWGPGTAWRFIRPGHSSGNITTLQAYPLHVNNLNYMRILIERVGHYYDFDGWTGVGLQNDGFNGMNVKAGAKYDFSAFMRNVSGKAKEVRIALVVPGREQKLLADQTVKVVGPDWNKVEAVLEPTEDCPNAVLQILVLTVGEMDIDAVSLMPEDTFMGHGLRKDLAETLQAMHPRFMRFPGGCVVHGGGDGFWNTYRWKTTLGPKHERKQLKNTWSYHQSMGLGYFEYFQFCEDIGMEPLPILPCGVSCQGVNGGWGMKDQAQDACPMDEMDEWVDEALDLIEWANGDVTTKWGRVRAEAGHPEPFNLKYLGIGNEERISPEFMERFKYIYDRVVAAHPEIIIVGTAGPSSHPGNPDYDNSWKFAEEIGLPIIDEHYYEPTQYYLDSRQYDNYPRDRKTKVYLGEYSAQNRGRDNQLLDALAEAVYLMHVERNADVVEMTSYAPLFASKDNRNWTPDLIYFDTERVYPTCSYYVQQMFGESAGQYYYGDCVSIEGADKHQEQSVVLNVKTRELFVKVGNASADKKVAKVDLSRFKGMKKVAERTVLSGNPEDGNTFGKITVEPVRDVVNVKPRMTLDIEPYSFVMLKIKL
ncbi:MAG: alpha-N-arabinofuranosidase [Bacteroidales bacterium]|nr:alpha-N-arabinofuranosidase [Bacteroidales bacterium]